jgi:hypothetical protein
MEFHHIQIKCDEYISTEFIMHRWTEAIMQSLLWNIIQCDMKANKIFQCLQMKQETENIVNIFIGNT